MKRRLEDAGSMLPAEPGAIRLSNIVLPVDFRVRKPVKSKKLSNPQAERSSAGLVTLLLGLASAMWCLSAQAVAQPIPSPDYLESHHARIGQIIIESDNVFDPTIPEEDHRVYRLANRLHVQTRSTVIERQLLFKTGDEYDQRVLEESERILRSNSYLHDATIMPVHYEDDSVDILVHTTDVWTTDPRLSIGRSGGENNYTVGFKDSNLLGTGIYLGMFQKKNVDRSSTQLVVQDRELGSSRYALSTALEHNSDGHKAQLLFGKPFYELDSHNANAVGLLSEERVDSLWDRGEVQAKFRHRIHRYDFSAGMSKGLREGWVNRYSAGMTYDEHDFEPFPDEVWPRTVLPADRKYVYPFVQWELLEDDYEEAHNHDQIGLTEDRFLGSRLLARVGYASTALGSSGTAMMLDLAAHTGFGESHSNSLLIDAGFHGRFEEEAMRDSILSLDTVFHHRHSEHALLHLALSGLVGNKLDLDHQILLGGDNGLRGYPLRYQGGTSSLLFTAEERVFTDWYPFHLFHVGGAVFFDAGRTWGENPVGDQNLGWLKDVGFGLRFGNSRSGIGRVVHLDFAFPLDGGSGIDSLQILFKGKTSF